MQIKRAVEDLDYARKQLEKGGAFFQLWTEGLLTSMDTAELAPSIAADAITIWGRREPLDAGTMSILDEMDKQMQELPRLQLLAAVYCLGHMRGIGHERTRRMKVRA